MGQASKYENKNPLHQRALSRFLKRIKNSVDDVKAARVLELGSADGYVVKYLKNHNPALELCGVDIDEEALERAREMNPETRFEYGNLETGILPKERFDITMVLEVFEHIQDTEKALLNMKKLNSKYFLISVPREPFFRILNFLRGRHWGRLGNHPEHLHVWRKNEFRRVVSKYFVVKKDYSSFPWTILLATKKDY